MTDHNSLAFLLWTLSADTGCFHAYAFLDHIQRCVSGCKHPAPTFNLLKNKKACGVRLLYFVPT